MHFIVELLTWPIVLFLQAVCGVLNRTKTPKMALYQKIARLALFAAVVVFATIPLSMVTAPAIGAKPLLFLTMVLLIVFVFFGNLCDENKDSGEYEE
ncbi:MAG: hypothetical protein GX594_11030 [Pirellulaceae bacterium]|nr:hypothetical protein [Pirellulaceae bacterium]